jgi:hypothetical protein
LPAFAQADGMNLLADIAAAVLCAASATVVIVILALI